MNEIKQSGGKAIGITADATDETAINAAFETIKKELPGSRLAAAIYNVNAGFARKPFLELTKKDLDTSLDAAPYVHMSPLKLVSVLTSDAGRAFSPLPRRRCLFSWTQSQTPRTRLLSSSPAPRPRSRALPTLAPLRRANLQCALWVSPWLENSAPRACTWLMPSSTEVSTRHGARSSRSTTAWKTARYHRRPYVCSICLAKLQANNSSRSPTLTGFCTHSTGPPSRKRLTSDRTLRSSKIACL